MKVLENSTKIVYYVLHIALLVLTVSEAYVNYRFSCTSDKSCIKLAEIDRSLQLFLVRLIINRFKIFLTRLPSKQELRWLRTRKPLAYRESTCTNLSVSCPYEIIVYSVLKHINTARMHTISRQFIPLIYCSLGKRILSKIQPILPFH